MAVRHQVGLGTAVAGPGSGVLGIPIADRDHQGGAKLGGQGADGAVLGSRRGAEHGGQAGPPPAGPYA
ncbi:hypothetical protein ACFVZ3_30575 [Kitasatospora purpeofusca]|uniref:hypothetical protein n=1 Tax=Kitasatospora purpeofusca TaxID=67352 RepID=UPI00369D146F